MEPRLFPGVFSSIAPSHSISLGRRQGMEEEPRLVRHSFPHIQGTRAGVERDAEMCVLAQHFLGKLDWARLSCENRSQIPSIYHFSFNLPMPYCSPQRETLKLKTLSQSQRECGRGQHIWSHTGDCPSGSFSEGRCSYPPTQVTVGFCFVLATWIQKKFF